jgi:hypothetical protein
VIDNHVAGQKLQCYQSAPVAEFWLATGVVTQTITLRLPRRRAGTERVSELNQRSVSRAQSLL